MEKRELVLKIAYDISNTDLSLQDIAKKYNVNYSYVYSINTGEKIIDRIILDGMEFPLRYTSGIRNNLIRAELKKGVKVNELAEKYNTTSRAIYEIIRRDAAKGISYGRTN